MGIRVQSCQQPHVSAHLYVSLQPFRQLLRLDLSDNLFKELGGLSASTSLKWLSVANNQLETVPQLEIPELQARQHKNLNQ